RRCKDWADLAAISGVGPAKLERYADEVLAVVAAGESITTNDRRLGAGPPGTTTSKVEARVPYAIAGGASTPARTERIHPRASCGGSARIRLAGRGGVRCRAADVRGRLERGQAREPRS